MKFNGVNNDAIRGQNATQTGCKFTYTDAATVTMSADGSDSKAVVIVKSDTDIFSVTISASLTCALTTSGAGGLDTGAKASNKGYYIFVITKPDSQSEPALLCSLSDTSPTMPSGYTHCSKPIWFISSNSNSDIREFTHTNGRCYYVDLDDCLALASGINYGDDWGIIECLALAPNNSTVMMETWAIATDTVSWDEEAEDGLQLLRTEAVKIRRGDHNSYHLLLWMDIIKNLGDDTRTSKAFPLIDSELGLLYTWLTDPGLGPPDHPSLNVTIHGWLLR
jgi:hypothetical protein